MVSCFERCSGVEIADAEIPQQSTRAPPPREQNLSDGAAAPEHLRGSAATKRVPRETPEPEINAERLQTAERMALPFRGEKTPVREAMVATMSFDERDERAVAAKAAGGADTSTSHGVAEGRVLAVREADRDGVADDGEE